MSVQGSVKDLDGGPTVISTKYTKYRMVKIDE